MLIIETMQKRISDIDTHEMELAGLGSPYFYFVNTTFVKKYIYSKFRLFFNGRPLKFNEKEYVRGGDTLVRYSTELCDTYEEAQQIRAFVAKLRGVSPKSIDIKPCSSNVLHVQERPFSAAVNKALELKKTFNGVGLKLNTMEPPARYKKGAYQGKSDNNLLKVAKGGKLQKLKSLSSDAQVVRVVDNDNIKQAARSMNDGQKVRSVYFHESVEHSKGKSVIFDQPKYKERPVIVQDISNLREGGYFTLDNSLVESLKKSGMAPKEMRQYLRERNFSQRQAQKIMAQI